MFYTIYVRPVTGGKTLLRHVYGHYRKLENAKTALMDWVRGVLALDSEKKYAEKPADGRGREKVVLCVTALVPLSNAGMEGFIVENKFEDEEPEESFTARFRKCGMTAEQTAKTALADGETIQVPYTKDDEDGNNFTVGVRGRHGIFYVDLMTITRKKDKLEFVGYYNEKGQEESFSDYDMDDNEWPSVADLILELKNKEQ